VDDFVWILHPDTGGKARIPAAALDGWKVRDWQETTAPPEVDPATQEREAVEAAESAQAVRSTRKSTSRE
jgi:hypothetical protein